MESLSTRLKLLLEFVQGDQEAVRAAQSDADVSVSLGRTLEFKPAKPILRAGLILYPGGRCDPVGYAPLARGIAQSGVQVFIPRMPLGLAVLGAKRAQCIIDDNPEIDRWFLGGHSMGGVMAVAFAAKSPSQLSGLFLIGSYVAKMNNLADSNLKVTVVHATEDHVLNPENVDQNPNRLPPHTKFVTIQGGDHYQYGSFRNGARTATISRDEQQKQVIESLVELAT